MTRKVPAVGHASAPLLGARQSATLTLYGSDTRCAILPCMHELSIAYNLVEIADEAARKAGAVRVKVVYLRLGALAGVVEDALRFGFPVAAVGTLVEGAELRIEPVAVQVQCDHCAAPRTLTPPYAFRCPVCGQPAVKLVQGRELQIESIEIEEAESEETEENLYATAHS